MKPHRTLAPAALAAAVALSAAPAQGQRGFDWSGVLAPGATLRIFTVNGSVNVRASSGTAVRIHGDTENASSSDPIRYVMDRGNGGIRVCALRENSTCSDNGVQSRGDGWRNGWRGGRRSRASFTVEVPRGVVVRAGSGNGDVVVEGATADVNASSGNGDVRVGAGAAQVRASTGNGTVLVDGARGPVNASSGNGRVAITTASGPVSASTGNGRIEVAISALRGSGDMTFSSGNGSVTLTLPDDFSADVEASTGNGGIHTDFPLRVVGRMSPHHLSGTIGSGGRRLHISTGNGTITLRRG